jgi:hypothetical protein
MMCIRGLEYYFLYCNAHLNARIWPHRAHRHCGLSAGAQRTWVLPAGRGSRLLGRPPGNFGSNERGRLWGFQFGNCGGGRGHGAGSGEAE